MNPVVSPIIAGLLSFFIPGAGQVYLKHGKRGLAIFGIVFTLAFLTNWGLGVFNIGRVTVSGITTSWLWLLIGLFWLWNVLDACRLAQGRGPASRLGLLIPVILIYAIAWQVTDVNMDRLVTRFKDAQTIFFAIFHPDLFEQERVEYANSIPFWLPCPADTRSLVPDASSPGLAADRPCGQVGETITLRGEGYPPGLTGQIFWVDGEERFRVQEEIQTGSDGGFIRSIKVPAFAGRHGLDPNYPAQQAIEVRFEGRGAWHPTENFGEIVGKVVMGPAPNWMVQLGLVQPEGKIPHFLPGKIVETVAIGLLSTLLSVIFAIPLSFLAARNIMSRVPGGMALYYAMRSVLNVVRSVDTLIWGIIIIVWVGLGSFAGILALAIHSIAALGKLYSEEIEHIDPGPIEAVMATGATLLQTIRYAVVPQIVPPFLAYTLLRWDINMRSATVVGFVAGGGIGFYVVETIRKGGYEQYAAALWIVAAVIMLVDYLSARWRERIIVGEGKVTTIQRPFYRSIRSLFYAVLILALLAYSWTITGIDLKKLLEPAPTFLKLVRDFIAIDLSPDVLDLIVKDMFTTVFQALIATTIGALVAIPFSFLGAHNLMGGSKVALAIYYGVRFLFNFLRSIEALLYVAIFVFWVGIGPFAGALALAVTTFALIGKLFSEAIEGIDPGPVEAIVATGANRLQTIVYGILPQILPPFISYSIYQWDINIRIATIIGFAGGGGIGLRFYNYFNTLQYHKAGTVVAAIVIVITIMDLASAKIRERLV